MKYLKLFEDFNQKIDFFIEDQSDMIDEDHEMKVAEEWSAHMHNKEIKVKSVEGEVSEETVDLDIVMNNGDIIQFSNFYHVGPTAPSKHEPDYADLIVSDEKYDVTEEYIDKLSDGSVLKAILDLYKFHHLIKDVIKLGVSKEDAKDVLDGKISL